MKRFTLATVAACLMLSLSVCLTGCGSPSEAGSKMSDGDHMSTDDKIGGDKMDGDKMDGDKMDGDKMDGDKMGGDKMGGDKMGGDKMGGQK